MTAVLRHPAPAASHRTGLAGARQALRESYLKRPNPRLLLRGHAQLIDRTVRTVWNEIGMPAGTTLVATGGYGRGELYPSSDIDLLVLLAAEPAGDQRERIERLIGTFW